MRLKALAAIAALSILGASCADPTSPGISDVVDQSPDAAVPLPDPTTSAVESEQEDGSDTEAEQEPSDLGVETVREQIRSVIVSYALPIWSEALSVEEHGCLASSVLDSLTDARTAQLAPVLRDATPSGWLPGDAFSHDEAELIEVAASECLDWAARMGERMAYEDLQPPADSPPCVADTMVSDQFARSSVGILLFDLEIEVNQLVDLLGQDCYAEAVRTQVQRRMTALGVSEASADCAAQHAADIAVSSASDRDADAQSPEDAFAELLDAIQSCLTEVEWEEIQGLSPP